MRAEDQQPVRPRIVLHHQIVEGREVVQRLRHLLAADLDESVVHPVLGEAPTERDGLRPLVLVVGEGQVQTTAVQIEPVAQQVETHDHALGVPTGATRSPG